MFIVMSSMARPIWEISRFIQWMQNKCQAAADAQTKTTDLGCESICSLTTIYTHRHHLLLLLLSPKADTHFTTPQRIEGWVDLVGWLHTEIIYPTADGHPSKY